jgi:hypothetical protein
MSNVYDKNSKYFKKIDQLQLKEDDLQKRYFYKINNSGKKPNIFQLMENGSSSQSELEQVDNVCSRYQNFQKELEKKQIDCMKSMILHHKQIPEKWIIQENYKDLLNKVMEDPIVLSYAIESKDFYKKRSTSIPIEEFIDENSFISQPPSGPRFISYINPYKKNDTNSLGKQRNKIMREYCNNINKELNKKPKNLKSLKNSKTINDDKNYYLRTEESKENYLPSIFTKKKSTKDNKNEKLMVTSLHYDENKLNKKSKEKKYNLDKSENNNKSFAKINSSKLPIIG